MHNNLREKYNSFQADFDFGLCRLFTSSKLIFNLSFYGWYCNK